MLYICFNVNLVFSIIIIMLKVSEKSQNVNELENMAYQEHTYLYPLCVFWEKSLEGHPQQTVHLVKSFMESV